MLARGLATISGLTPADALLLVSNVAGLLAIVVLFKLVREEFGDQLALATTALLSFFPASVLLSAGYTEPLALLLIVSFFLALKRKYYLSAALLAGLAVSTRSTGVVLLPVLLWEMWASRDHAKFLLALVPCVLLATSGIWLFMIYLWSAFGTPFAFAEGWSRLRASWTLFATAVLLLPYLTLSGGPAGFVSMSRFNLVSFPLFVTLAGLGLRAKWLLAGVLGLFGASLFMNTALFARRIWIG